MCLFIELSCHILCSFVNNIYIVNLCILTIACSPQFTLSLHFSGARCKSGRPREDIRKPIGKAQRDRIPRAPAVQLTLFNTGIFNSFTSRRFSIIGPIRHTYNCLETCHTFLAAQSLKKKKNIARCVVKELKLRNNLLSLKE